MRVPVDQPYTITTGFNVPDSNAKFGYHSGVDLAVPEGRPVYAPASGSLRNILSPTGGNMVQIFDGQMYHRLMHNSSFSRQDGAVAEGEEVARAGTTGLSTGPHCHWDVSPTADPPEFNFVDPFKYIEENNDMPTLTDATDVKAMFQSLLGRDPGEINQAEIDGRVGKDFKAQFYELLASKERSDVTNLVITALFKGSLQRTPSDSDLRGWSQHGLRQQAQGISTSPEAAQVTEYYLKGKGK